MPEFDIKQLCEMANVSPRTVHFYIQQGLIPAASSPGPGARYTRGHLSRLRLIRLLQQQHLPLAEIAKRLTGLADKQVEQILAETSPRRAPESRSALEYIRGVLTESGRLQPGGTPPVQAKASQLRARPAEATLSSGTARARSQWDRFTLADGVELHVRRPVSRLDQRRLDKLLAAARTVFDDAEGKEQS